MFDNYAAVYDAIGQGRYSAIMAGRVLEWLAGRGLRPARVLDIACGTGEAALVFAGAGAHVAGVDQSARMLEIARGKARDAGYAIAFAQGDMRDLADSDRRPKTKDQRPKADIESDSATIAGDSPSFVLGPSSLALRPSSFDLVTCFADSLNYLTRDGDLDRVFGGVAAALRPGGYFVCDMNTAAEYATWDERDVVTYDGRDILVYNRLSYDEHTRRASGRIVWFAREIERWWRGEETHAARAWSEDEVRGALAGAGLELAGRLSVEGANAADDERRVVYLARRLDGDER